MKFNRVVVVVILAALVLGCAALCQAAQGQTSETFKKLVPPANGKIEVAFVMSDGAVMIDFAGPWEVFSNVHVYGNKNAANQHPFHLYTVAETKATIRASGGMRIEPDYTFEDAPKPTVVVVPAQGSESPKLMAWLNKMTKQSDVVMSVCTGAFVLAQAGVLDGKKATTHHDGYEILQHKYPKISVQRGMRYVRSDSVLFTSGGLSSGIDLALHIVDLYFGRSVTEATARHLEYEGKGWVGDGSASMSFEEPAKRGLKATLDNLDKDQYGNPLADITRKGNVLEFSMMGEGKYRGIISGDGSRIDGTFTAIDGTTSIPWNMTRVKPAQAQTNGTGASGEDAALIGDWAATIAFGNQKFRIVLHIQYSE